MIDHAGELIVGTVGRRANLTSLPPTDWMAALDGERQLGQLTIPGTHDSAARHGSPRARTQRLDVAGQLAAGIRFLDIRLKDEAGVLRLYHGKVDQRARFESGVIEPIEDFLAGHPGETVIMSIKQEDAGDRRSFAAGVERVLERRADRFRLSADLPSLGAVRGKIVVLRRFAESGIGIAAGPTQWLNNTTFAIASTAGTLAIEDEWEVAGPLPWQLEAKWTAVRRSLEAAAQADGSASTWHITFTSGTSDFIWPRAIATGIPFVHGMNRRLMAHVIRRRGRQQLGTIVMDFPDGALIQRLVDTNA